jgi:hypothetical protein
MSWAARITTAPGVELRVVFSEPVRTLDMTRDTARKLAGLILVAAEDREPMPSIELAEKPGVSRRPTVGRQELSGNHVRRTVRQTSPQPKTGIGGSGTFGALNITSSDAWLKTSQTYSQSLCCCVVPFGARGCAVHVVAKWAPAGVLSADVEPKTRRAASRPNIEVHGG